MVRPYGSETAALWIDTFIERMIFLTLESDVIGLAVQSAREPIPSFPMFRNPLIAASALLDSYFFLVRRQKRSVGLSFNLKFRSGP
jgi:hypothetical protein